MKRIVCIFALTVAIFAILFLVSCSSEEDNGLSEYQQLLESVSQSDTEKKPEAFAKKVYVIIPKSCSAELSLKAAELADAIEAKTGVYALVKYDNEEIKVLDDELTLLLGNTQRLESREAVKPLRYEDYVCRWDKGSVILGGRHDEATIMAVGEFMDKILHGASNVCLMSEGAHFEHIVDRDISSVTLNGYDLYDYTLVYSESNSFGERKMAELLREYTVNKSGYMLNIIPDSKVDSNMGKTVFVSGLADISGAEVRRAEKNIVICGAGEYELSAAVAEFADRLFENVIDGKATATVTDINIPCEDASLKICYAVSKSGNNALLDYFYRWSVLLQNERYDVIVFDRTEDWLLNRIEENKYGYTYVPLRDGNGNVYPVMYNEDAFQSFECSISDSAIVIKAKAAGELDERRIIVSVASDEGNVKALLADSAAYDTLILKEELSKAAENEYGLSFLGSGAWGFDSSQYKAVFYAKEGLRAKGESVKTDGGVVGSEVNIFISAELSPKVCAKLEGLKNTVK